MFSVYILLNHKGELYKGMTNNLVRRISEHNANKNPRSRGKGPWKLVYSEQFITRLEVREREKYFKSGKGREILKKLIDSPVAQR